MWCVCKQKNNLQHLLICSKLLEVVVGGPLKDKISRPNPSHPIPLYLWQSKLPYLGLSKCHFLTVSSIIPHIYIGNCGFLTQYLILCMRNLVYRGTSNFPIGYRSFHTKYLVFNIFVAIACHIMIYCVLPYSRHRNTAHLVTSNN